MAHWGKVKLVGIAISTLFCIVLLSACNYTALDADKSNAVLFKEAVANTKTAQSYHLSVVDSDARGQASDISGDVDAANGRFDVTLTGGGRGERYVQVGKDTFISDDGGQSYYKSGDGGSAGDASVPMLAGFTGQLGNLGSEETDSALNALKDGNPALESIDGVVTKHIIARYSDISSLVPISKSVQTTSPDVVEMWLTLGASPTVRRLKLEGGNKAAGVTLDWTALDEPVAIATPKDIQMSNSDLLQKAGLDMQAAKSYQMDVDLVSDGQDVTLTALMDVANNNTRMDIVSGGQNVSTITIGSDTYISLDNGKTYTQSDLGSMFTSSFGSFTGMWQSFTPGQLNLDKRILTNGIPRTEKIGGVFTRHMALDASPLASSLMQGSPGSIISGKLDFWISTDATPYVYQIKIDSSQGSQVYTATLKWSRFNEDLGIKAPPADKLLQPTPVPTAISDTDTVPRISLPDFKALYDDPAKRPLILDVRSKDLYDAGHIKGAISFPEADVDTRVGELPKDRLIVAYCQ